MIVVHDALSDYPAFRKHCDGVDYTGQINPVDGVMYPGLSTDIPAHVKQEVREQIKEATGVDPHFNYLFLRLNLAGVKAPHQAHHDGPMGNHTCILYLNRPEHCQGGTSFIRHKHGLPLQLTTPEHDAVWLRDVNRPEAWEVTDMCPMITNSLLIFPSEKWHRSEPVGSFGDNAANGRLVLIAFAKL